MDIKEQAKAKYLAGESIKQIAEQLGKSAGTIRSWKSRDKWDGDADKPIKKSAKQRNKNSATLQRNTATQHENVATQIVSDETIDKINESDMRDRHKAFTIEYLKSFNATQAYLNVYDVDYNTAMSAGSRLLTNDKVKDLIKELRKERLSDLAITQEDLLSDLVKEARADIGDFVEFGQYDEVVLDSDKKPKLDVDGKEILSHRSWVQFKDKAKVDTSAIESIKMGKDGPVLKLHDRDKARKQLLEHFDSVTTVDKHEDVNPFDGISKTELREVLRGQSTN